MTKEQLRIKRGEVVGYYSQIIAINPYSSIIREVKGQYRDMAAGGDGGDLGFVDDISGERTCRAMNYPGYPDHWFQEVMNLLGWS